MKNPANHSLTVLMLATLFSFSASAGAEDSDSGDRNDVAPLFASYTPLQVRIEAPLKTLMKERPNEDYLEGTFSFVDDNGAEQILDLKLRTRGHFRREERNCDFAPIRLNFRKKQVDGTVFAGQDKLKLVTHCQDYKPAYEQHLLREYLAYRIFQVMTDKSFDARLMHITYFDAESEKSMTKYGFVIEDDDDVAERNGMESVKIGSTTHGDLDYAQETLVNVFQFMIGNTDFSLVRGPDPDECCHNAVLLSASGGAPFMPMPYDFDFSGLVGAPYAEPNPKLPIKSVRIRLYRGECSNNEQIESTIRRFLDKKDAIYAVIDELDMLAIKDKGVVTRYLDSFFDIIAQPEMVERRIIDKCN